MHVILVLVWDSDGITWVWRNFYVYTKIKQLFLNDFRRVLSPSTHALNGLHRCVWAIPFDGSDHLMPTYSTQGSYNSSQIKEQFLNLLIYIEVPPHPCDPIIIPH